PNVELPPTTPSTDQVTLVLLEPVTVAVNCCDVPGCRVAEVGDTVTKTLPPLESLLTVTLMVWPNGPAASQALAVMRCVPTAIASVPKMLLPVPLATLVPST